mgnify:CR=1 FL=1
MDASQLLQGGAAGAIILVVVLFLRFIEDQRRSQQNYSQSNEAQWREALRGTQENHRETITMVVDQFKDAADRNTQEHEGIVRTLERIERKA